MPEEPDARIAPSDDTRHVVFPVVTAPYGRAAATATGDGLSEVSSALAREGRDLVREAAGGRPVEGVGATMPADRG